MVAMAFQGCGSEGALPPAQAGFHTSPERWSAPRTFHRPFDESFGSQIHVTRVDLASASDDRQPSPNNAYWFARASPDTTQPGPSRALLDVFNERDYLVRILIEDDRGLGVARWINEKLLYVEIWWGRVLGTSLIFDVEAERIIHREMVHEGTIPFQQYQAAARRPR